MTGSGKRRTHPSFRVDGETFLRVAIPLAGQGLWAGAALACARALGEFGATLMFAGSFQGRRPCSAAQTASWARV